MSPAKYRPFCLVISQYAVGTTHWLIWKSLLAVLEPWYEPMLTEISQENNKPVSKEWRHYLDLEYLMDAIWKQRLENRNNSSTPVMSWMKQQLIFQPQGSHCFASSLMIIRYTWPWEICINTGSAAILPVIWNDVVWPKCFSKSLIVN